VTRLPDGWRLLDLAAVARWGSGGTPTAGRPDYYGGDIPWAVIGDLTDGPVRTTRATITTKGLAESSAKLVPAGSVLVAMYGSIGNLGITEIEMATNQAIAFAVVHDFVDARYLFHYLASQRDALSAAGKGATQKNISQTLLKAWPIPVPPLTEQRRIVDILEDHLSHLDAANDYLSVSLTRIRALEDSTVMSRLIPSSTADVVAGITEGALPDVPNGWRWTTLGDVAAVVGGVTKDAKKQDDPTYVEVPYLRVANVQRARLDLTTVSTIRVRPDQAQALRLRPGDVLMNEGGDRDKLARGWVWSDEVPNCIHQNHVFRARAMPDVVRPEWLAWCSNTYGTRWAQRHGRQSVNLASISLTTLKTMPIPLPPLQIQNEALREIAVRRDALRGLLNAMMEATTRSAVLRRSLLEAAFSGRLTSHASHVALAEEIAFA